MIFRSQQINDRYLPNLIKRYTIMPIGHFGCIYAIITLFYIQQEDGEIFHSKWSRFTNGFSHMDSDDRIMALILSFFLTAVIWFLVFRYNKNKFHIIGIAWKSDHSKIKFKTKRLFSTETKTEEFLINELSVKLIRTGDGISLDKVDALGFYRLGIHLGSLYLSETYWEENDINSIKNYVSETITKME